MVIQVKSVRGQDGNWTRVKLEMNCRAGRK